ncbi:MAG: hypothetical protein IJP68_13445, partial [Selenomonadaceae bacterium]|nr:hypothetical protein [Selenomonadaceae bacterium]
MACAISNAFSNVPASVAEKLRGDVCHEVFGSSESKVYCGDGLHRQRLRNALRQVLAHLIQR